TPVPPSRAAPVAPVPVQMAAAAPTAEPSSASRVVAAASPMRTVQPLPSVAAAPTPVVAPTRAAEAPQPVALAANTPPRPVIQPLPATQSTPTSPTPSSSGASTAMVQPLPVEKPEPAPTPVVATVQPVSTQAPAALAATGSDRDVAPVTPPRRTERKPSLAAAHAVREDSVLARIVANLSIPASELGVEGPERPVAVAANVPVNNATQRVLAEARAKAERDEAAREKAAEVVETAPRAPTAAERKAAAAKAAAEKKALAAKKAEAAKKALADKAEAEEKRRAKANPERIWVQVAGGANEDDLPKAWAATKAKAPTVFAGHKGYKAPLRATHRVLTGPFKTDAEARAFINQLAKKGVSAFPVTSEAGQAVTRLDAK
ncbi:SPOR domain-containing protein, partial [Sphingomonas sp. Leaf21]|uniref:SPOR domain-containing protein n=1 Tax=Sphingomonas sp. Leaf21 TaxID=2876550 RepID=UPI001E4A8830